ncbi:FAD-dependent monooxygenase [Pseudonocardia sp. CA-107938]|uniref:FAD-dependent monooxygenase n=1 Tax=Pseudonocardia sp. CA-107938 TaxID=3240021 RepID=UPI003D8B02EE
MLNQTVLISGASIAGPSLAFWLERYGATVTVVERAPALRPGGQAIDFKGAVHRQVLEAMGLWDAIAARQTGGQDQTVVDADGRALAVLPGDVTGGELEIRRGDLAEILYEATRETCEYVFGDEITSLTETADGVHVTFAKGAARTFDLVVGADGIHSAVRRLAFGPEEQFVTYSGWYYALADLGVAGDHLMYNEPGRMVAIGGSKAPAFFVFASPQLSYDRYDAEQQKQVLREAYAGGRWRIPELLDRLPEAASVYVDSISRVSMDRWSSGRVVLLGDAGYGSTLAGFGSGLAVVGAYVLAGELLAADGDHVVAFRRYEEVFRSYAGVGEKGRPGAVLAPRTRMGIRARNLMLRTAWMMRLTLWITDRFATAVELRDYPALARSRQV